MTDEEFQQKKMTDLIVECARLREKLKDSLSENVRLKEENASIATLKIRVAAAETENKKLAEEKRRADGIAQQRAFELIRTTMDDLDHRAAILKKGEEDLAARANNFDAEVEKMAETKYQSRIIEPQKELDRRKNAVKDRENILALREQNLNAEVEKKVETQKKMLENELQKVAQQKRKLDEERATYKTRLDTEYQNAVGENEALKIILKIGTAATAIVLIGMNFLWWKKNRVLEKNNAIVYHEVLRRGQRITELTQSNQEILARKNALAAELERAKKTSRKK